MICLSGYSNPKSGIIWQIGTEDRSAAEFALAPDLYETFLENDFGWEDRYYLVGKSNPKEHFPYVLPGPADSWGGTSSTAGIRAHVLNILFRMRSVPEDGEIKLIINILDTHHASPPYFKVTVNGRSWKYLLPKGGGDASLSGDYEKCIHHRIEILLEKGLIKEGGNEISLTSLEGSWLIFDAIRLEGATDAVTEEKIGQAYLRGVEVAQYQTVDPPAQPLLIDLEHLEGSPLVEVTLDGESILSEQLEEGRYLLEAPMPAVTSKQQSSYEVMIDGRSVETGRVNRSPQKPVT
ncbi:MAG: hypothetical protein JJE08_11515, partial [Proteiniphilum sp.]|nr:hypothetical protein [Proteiniphilum sp.]